MQVESSTTPLRTIDEVERVQRQRIASFMRHVFQLLVRLWLVLLRAFISRVFQLILVQFFIVLCFYHNTSRFSFWGFYCRAELICSQFWAF